MGVASTSGTVTLNAGTSISNSNGVATDVTAGTLGATAGTSIDLDTMVGTATLTGPAGTATTGNITLDNSGTLLLGQANAGGGLSVTNSGGVLTLGTAGTQVKSGGATTVANTGGGADLVNVNVGGNLTVTNTGGALTLGTATTSVTSGGRVKIENTDDDIEVRHLVSTQATARTVTVVDIKAAGSIWSNRVGDPAQSIEMASGRLSLQAVGGSIGTQARPLQVLIGAPGTSAVVLGAGGGSPVAVGGDTTGVKPEILFSGGCIFWNAFSSCSITDTAAGAAVSDLLTNPAGQEVFEAVESQMIETLGDPSEQIEEELRLEDEDLPQDDKQKEEELKRRRSQQ
jgi:hypothetical protein